VTADQHGVCARFAARGRAQGLQALAGAIPWLSRASYALEEWVTPPIAAEKDSGGRHRPAKGDRGRECAPASVQPGMG
jgi:hypothetical protein